MWRSSGLWLVVGVLACTAKKKDETTTQVVVEAEAVPAQEPVAAKRDPAPPVDAERIGEDQPRQPVPGPDGEMAPHDMDFDGRSVTGPVKRGNTFASKGLTPIEGRTPGERIEVATIKELVTALGSNRTIVLQPGSYVWRDDDVLGYADKESTESYEGLSEHFDKGVIHDVENLTLVGLGEGARILQPDAYDHVLTFHNVTGLTLYNLILGHHVDKGWCAGGVLMIVGARDVVLDGLELFGSGTEGLTLLHADDVELRDSVVWGCTEQLSTIGNATDVRILRTDFRENGPELLRGFVVARSQVVLEDVVIADNHGPSGYEEYGSLFTIAPDHVLTFGVREELEPAQTFAGAKKTSVEVRRGAVLRNTFGRLTDRPGTPRLSGTRTEGNDLDARESSIRRLRRR